MLSDCTGERTDSLQTENPKIYDQEYVSFI